MTLIELMVALAIGAFLMIGAITVFMQSRTTFRVTESLRGCKKTPASRSKCSSPRSGWPTTGAYAATPTSVTGRDQRPSNGPRAR